MCYLSDERYMYNNIKFVTNNIHRTTQYNGLNTLYVGEQINYSFGPKVHERHLTQYGLISSVHCKPCVAHALNSSDIQLYSNNKIKLIGHGGNKLHWHDSQINLGLNSF